VRTPLCEDEEEDESDNRERYGNLRSHLRLASILPACDLHTHASGRTTKGRSNRDNIAGKEKGLCCFLYLSLFSSLSQHTTHTHTVPPQQQHPKEGRGAGGMDNHTRFLKRSVTSLHFQPPFRGVTESRFRSRPLKRLQNCTQRTTSPPINLLVVFPLFFDSCCLERKPTLKLSTGKRSRLLFPVGAPPLSSVVYSSYTHGAENKRQRKDRVTHTGKEEKHNAQHKPHLHLPAANGRLQSRLELQS